MGCVIVCGIAAASRTAHCRLFCVLVSELRAKQLRQQEMEMVANDVSDIDAQDLPDESFFALGKPNVLPTNPRRRSTAVALAAVSSDASLGRESMLDSEADSMNEDEATAPTARFASIVVWKLPARDALKDAKADTPAIGELPPIRTKMPREKVMVMLGDLPMPLAVPRSISHSMRRARRRLAQLQHSANASGAMSKARARKAEFQSAADMMKQEEDFAMTPDIVRERSYGLTDHRLPGEHFRALDMSRRRLMDQLSFGKFEVDMAHLSWLKLHTLSLSFMGLRELPKNFGAVRFSTHSVPFMPSHSHGRCIQATMLPLIFELDLWPVLLSCGDANFVDSAP